MALNAPPAQTILEGRYDAQPAAPSKQDIYADALHRLESQHRDIGGGNRKLDHDEAVLHFRQAIELNAKRRDTLRDVPHDKPIEWDKLEPLYPGIGKKFLDLHRDIVGVCMDGIDPTRLDFRDTELQKQYLEELIDSSFSKLLESGVAPGIYASYDKDQHFYYLNTFSFGRETPGHEMVMDLISKKKPDLTPEELNTVMDYEDTVVKLHVNIPPNQRKAFLQDYLSSIQKSMLARREIRNRKEAEGEVKPTVTDEELIASGVRPMVFAKMKMNGFSFTNIPDTEGNIIPDCIFYLDKMTPEMQRTFINELSPIVRKYEDPGGQVPRLSRFVTGPDGYRHTSFSVTQGDSNFKYWLKEKGLLDAYYDKSQNYSIRIPTRN
jgi:hypothetical protein